MQTAVQQTSLFAFKQVKPTLGDRQRIVYEIIKERENITNLEIASELGLPINTITPRCYELREMGYVKEWGKRPCKITSRLAIAWQEAKDTLF